MLKLTPSTAAIDHRTDLREGTGGSTATSPAVLYRYHFLLPLLHNVCPTSIAFTSVFIFVFPLFSISPSNLGASKYQCRPF